MEFASDHAFVYGDSTSNEVEVDEGAIHADLFSDLKQNVLTEADEEEAEDGVKQESSKESSSSSSTPKRVSSSASDSAPASSSSSPASLLSSASSALNSLFNRNRKKAVAEYTSAKSSAPQAAQPSSAKKRFGHTKPRPAGAASASNREPVAQAAHAGGRLVREKADTNVVAVKFGSLSADAEQVWSGDCFFCKNCHAALSSTSKVNNFEEAKKIQLAHAQNASNTNANSAGGKTSAEDSNAQMEMSATAVTASSSAASSLSPPSSFAASIPSLSDGESLWMCEFCSHANVLDISPEEIPRTSTRDYVLENPSAASSSSAAKSEVKSAEASSLILFVLDTSGSMCVTMPMHGQFKLKGSDKRGADKGFDIPLAPDEREAPRARQQALTYVSRLQCVQAAVDQQLEALKKSQPNKRVGLITFSNDVTVWGDGVGDVEVVTGDKLKNQHALHEVGQRLNVSRSVSEVQQKLSDTIFSLEESGQTALGPALTVAVSMASKVAGSRVVICTDGLSNIGVGSLDAAAKDAVKRQEVVDWYEGIGNMAKSHGVTVSVISIKGQDSALEDLGRVAEVTGGSVDKVDPLTLTQNFSSILQNPVIAVNVNATFLLHAGLRFRNESDMQAAGSNVIRRELGNVTEDSELTFEYDVNPQKPAQFKNLRELPFQLQIHFTKLNGMKCLRVISKCQPITFQREVAEKNVRMDLLAANAAQHSAKLAEAGDYDRSRAVNVAWSRFMAKNAVNEEQQGSFARWMNFAAPFQQNLQVQADRLGHVMNEVNAHAPPAAPMNAVPAAAATGLGAAAPAASMAFTHASAASSSTVLRHAARHARNDEDYTEIAKTKAKSSKAFK